jgi:hypothetical protein
MLLLASQADGLADKQVRKHKIRGFGTEFESVAIRKCLDASIVSQAKSLPKQPIDVYLAAMPESRPGIKVRRKRFLNFAVVVEAVWTGIQSRESGIALRCLRDLTVDIPLLRGDCVTGQPFSSRAGPSPSMRGPVSVKSALAAETSAPTLLTFRIGIAAE